MSKWPRTFFVALFLTYASVGATIGIDARGQEIDSDLPQMEQWVVDLVVAHIGETRGWDRSAYNILQYDDFKGYLQVWIVKKSDDEDWAKQYKPGVSAPLDGGDTFGLFIDPVAKTVYLEF